MIRVGFPACVLIFCTQIGFSNGQSCSTGQCSRGHFADPDLELNPDQACYDNGTSVNVTCPNGLYSGPPSPFTCSSGSFGPPGPDCTVANCDPPAVQDDVEVSPNKSNYNYLDVVTYTCKDGKSIQGPNSAACEVGGWNPSNVPECLATCTAPDIANGNLTSSGPFNDGDTATADCYPGYDIGPGESTSLTCEGTEWDAVPTCYARCILPAVPNSDNLEARELTHTSESTIECDDGYSNNQTTQFKVTCNDGDLDGFVPNKCYKDCEPLRAPQHGSTAGGFLHGETMYYSCNRGYLLNETTSETCYDGSWSEGEDTPTCYDVGVEGSILLNCYPSYYNIEIPLILFDNDTAGVNSVLLGGVCPGTDADDLVIYINSTYTDCGTTLEVNPATDQLEYENAVVNADNSGEKPITTDSALVINILCAFDQNNLVSSSAVMQSVIMENRDGKSGYSISFNVYSDAGFSNPIAGLVYVDTNSDIFIKAQVNNVLELDVFPIECYATPESSSEKNISFSLITNGTSDDEEFATNIRGNDVDGKPSFTFQSKAFRFSNNPSQSIYIHCWLKICPDNECPLPDSGSRRRRSIRNTQLTVTKYVLAGPIKIREPREADEASTSSSWEMTAVMVYSATLSLFAVGVIAIMGVLVYRRRPTDGYGRL